MKATIYVMKDDKVTHKPTVVGRPESLVTGISLPYLTRDGFPHFQFEGDPVNHDDMYQGIDAVPGMVGANYRGEFYVIDSDGEAQRLPVVVITEREHERLKLHANSHIAPAA